MLELKLLGSPQILLDGQLVSGLAAAKSQALLFYLAVNGRPQSRLALAGLLWPDKRETDALANLRQSLYHLRNALPDYLEINRLTIAFHTALPCQIDAVLFEKEVAESNDLVTRQTAMDRYNGEFLDGFYVDEAEPFEAWAVVIRERLHRLATEALQDLVADFDAHQEITLGLRYVNQWLALEPWQEAAHRHKIQFLAWDGQMQAALAHYKRCRQLLAEELGAEPSAETVALVEQIQRGESVGKTRRQEGKKTEDQKTEDQKIEAPALSSQNRDQKAPAEVKNQQDWGEMPDVRTLWGRDAEIAQVEQWLVTEQQRVVIILGMGGMGKTTLAATLAPRLAPHFAWVLWRSLLNAPPLSDILRDWVQTLSGYTLTTWPTLLDAQLTLLFEQLRKQRCLLIFDNVESILSPANEQQGGAYPPEYAEYGQFFARLGDSAHQSALLLTSRELPPELARLERKGAPVRRLPLAGLPLDAGQRLLADDGLVGTIEQQHKLLRRYSGNPLALQLVSRTIQDFFAGEIAAFLSDETLFFDDVREVLDQQFSRLTTLERELLLWLAIEREPLSLPLLQQQLLYTGPKSAVIEALLDLQQRTLLEKTPTGFTLQNVIMEYATAYLVDAVCQEIEAATLHLLHSHALLKAQAKEYIRQSQARLLLQPIRERLQKKLGSAGLAAQLKQLLSHLRQDAAGRATYAGGNILNLLVHCQREGQADLQQADFSSLAVWQAYLPGAELVDVNFIGSDLTNSVFAEQFGVMVSLAFSPDGQTLAAGAANDNKIRFWQVKTGQPLGTLVGHSGMVAELSFSPDGKRLASSSYDQTICLWDLQNLGTAAFYTQRPLQTLRGHEASVWCVVFSPDGQHLASGGKDQSVRLWDVGDSSRRAALRHTLYGHTSGLNAMTFSPDGQLLATGGLDCTVRIWHVASGQVLAQFHGHTGRIWRLAFSPDGRLLASGDWDHQIRLWDLADLPLPGATEPLLSDRARMLTGHDGHITQLRFSADGRTLVSCGDDRTLRLWDLTQAGTEVARYALQDHPGRNWSMDITPDGELLAGAGGDLSIRLWNVRNGQLLRRLQGHAQDVITVALDPTGTLLAASCQDHKVRLWDMGTQTLRSVLRGHTDGVEDVVFCAPRQGQMPLLASSSVDQTIRLWDVQSGQLLQTLRGHTSWIRTIAVSPDGRLLASASNDETVRLWSTVTGELLQTWSAPPEGSWCWAVAFSPNGKTLAVGCRLDLIYLWDIDSPNPPLNPVVLRGHTYSITTLAFSPDGALLASGSFDQTVRLWRVQTGESVAVLPGHEAWVWRVAFSPDGALLASVSEDQTLCLWEVASGQRRHRLQGHSNGVRGITFSADGKTVISGSSDGTIKGWDSASGAYLFTLAAPRPYEGMNITGATGLTEAQKMALKTLGALEEAPVASMEASHTNSVSEPKAQETTPVQEAPPHNLPQPTTPFVGRANDLGELALKLANPACRLLTLVGAGGMGKTRLAIQAAQMILDFGFVILDSVKTQDNPKAKIQSLSLPVQAWKDPKFADGVFFVGLAGVGSSDLLVSTIAAALGCTFYGSGDPKMQLLAYLRPKSLLLVLDNFEHLLDGVELVSDLLTTASGVKVLATSREPLNLREEWLHFLSGMSYPATGASDQVEAYTAIQLFTQCARQVQPDFDVASEAAAVAQICRLVEGMPLGIELAATWLKFYSCVQIAEEITHDLDFLTTTLRNVPTRHRSMRAIFEYSWRLLSPGEQHVLQRLAVFRGGFTQAAAEQVAGASRALLLALVERSLLQLTPAPRFQFHELMRQFAEEKLLTQPQAAAAIKERHSLHYLLLLQEQEAHLKGRNQLSTTAILEADIENVRTAWQWGVANHKVDAIDSALESLHTFYSMKYWFHEGETVFGQAVATLKLAEPVGKQGILIGKLLLRQGVMAVWFAWTAGEAGHWEKAAKLYQEAIAILSQVDAHAETGLALSALGALHFHLGKFEEANPLFAQALRIFTAQDNRVERGRILHELGVSLAAQGNYQEAIQTLQQGNELCEQSGDIRMRGEILNSLAQVYMAIEEYPVAQQMMQAILSARTVAGDQRGMASSLALLGDLAWRMGDYTTAQHYSQESLSLLQAIGLHKPKEVALNNLGNIACSLADYQQADEHFRAVLAINSTTGKLYYDRYVAVALNGLAIVLIQQGQRTQAAALLSLVIRHPATWQEMKNKATRLLAAFAAELPADTMAAIQAHPQPQDLAAFIMSLLTAPQATTPQATTPQAKVQKVALNALGAREETGALRQPDNTTIAPASAVSAPRLPPIALPAEVTGFVGRETEIVLVQQRLANPACRLLTITGMGGVGKSRLALRAAHLLAARLTNAQAPQFPDGIYFVPLAALEPHPQLEHLLATTVATVLGIPLTGEAPTSQLLQALAEKDLLLILDNCEHLSALPQAGALSLPPVTAFINQLLQQARAVKVLVTSRVRLHVRGEQLIRLTGLTIPTATLPTQVTPENLWQINEHSAIRLFVQNVQAILPGFALDSTTVIPVVQICQLLHGLPLGIELAATWAHLLPLPEIVQELRQNLDFLENAQLDVPAHQRSLRAVFNHSWQHLTVDEQQVLRRLTVFSGGFTREAAAQVAGATLPLLAQLTDKSLVQRSDAVAETLPTSAKGRYELQPVVRQYAAEQLSQAGETTTYQERHAAYMAHFLAAQRSALQSAQQQEALRTIHAEIENVRAAWQWLLTHLPTAQSALAQIAEQVSQGIDSLFHFYDMRSWFQEGEAVFGQLAQQLAAVLPPLTTPVAAHEPPVALWRLQAKAQARQGWFAFHRGRNAESHRLLTASLHRLQQLQAETDSIFTLNYLGAVLRHLGEFVQATAYLHEAQRLAEQHNDPMSASIALNILGQIALVQGDLAAAQRLCQQALAIKRTIGDRWGMIFSLGYLGRVAQATGDYAAAQKLFAECLTIARELDDQRGAAFALQCLGDTAYAAGDLTTAQAHYQESLAIYRAINSHSESSVTLARLGETYRASGAATQARQALREALASAWSLPSTPGLLAALLGLVNLALDAGQDADALPPLRFVAQHSASSQQQRQQATQLLATLGAAVTAEERDWDLTTYVQTILREG